LELVTRQIIIDTLTWFLGFGVGVVEKPPIIMLLSTPNYTRLLKYSKEKPSN